MGDDAIKLKIQFIQLSFDGSKTNLEDQNLYLSESNPQQKIDNIPWVVTLINTNQQEAVISIDKI
ncbi:hypothetical protein D3C86_1489530 [compost metagenome]